MFAYLVAAGVDRADAFFTIYNRKQRQQSTYNTQDTEAAEYIRNSPALRLLIQKLKNNIKVNTRGTMREVSDTLNDEIAQNIDKNKEFVDELSTKSGVVKKIQQELQKTHGKDAIAGLMTLAKLQGYDKEDDRTEDERRKFVLPFVSHCRSCRLMRIFMQVQEARESAPTE